MAARVGAVFPGTYNQNFEFAPGTRSAAVEPEFLRRKQLGWPELGVYADGLFRWNPSSANDQYITVVGLFQQIKGWELDAGYRHFQQMDIGLDGQEETPNLGAKLQWEIEW